MKDKTLRQQLFGIHTMEDNPLKHRRTTWEIPAISEDDIDRKIFFPASNGLILYLIKRIEKLEKQINLLKRKTHYHQINSDEERKE